MDALQVAALLDAWWPIVAGPRPADRGIPDDPSSLVWSFKVPWPQHTRSWVQQDVPVCWAARHYVDPRIQPSTTAAGTSPTDRSSELPGLRRLADHPITTDRWHLVLADPTPTLANGLDPTPAHASLCCQFVLTLRAVAVNLADRAALRTTPTRQLREEADAYSAEADQAEGLLAQIAAPWVDLAQADVSRAGTPVTSHHRTRYRTVPVNIK